MRVIVIFGFVAVSVYADPCLPPHLENGIINGRGSESMWIGHFGCTPGFVLVGNKVLKCMDGVWSSKPPVCTAIGSCDPRNLPNLKNGKKVKVRGFRGAVYRYECDHGYHMYGESQVYCRGDRWQYESLPVCTRHGCDESLVKNIQFGTEKRLAKGRVFRFECNPDSALIGSSLVYCDGDHWNDTTPRCVRGPASLELEGLTTEPEETTTMFTCRSSESHPPAELLWNMVDQDEQDITHLLQVSKSEVSWAERGWVTTSTAFVPKLPNARSVRLSCSGQNDGGLNMVHKVKHIDLQSPPQEVKVYGVSRAVQGDLLVMECESSGSRPAAQLTWALHQHGQIQVNQGQSFVEPQSDGSSVTRSLLSLPAEGGDAHHLVVECVANHPLLEPSTITYKHDVEILCPPGVPSISHVPRELELGRPQHISCRTKAGNPPASLYWYRGEQVINSHYRLEGDTAVADLYYVPTVGKERLTCQAVNEAVSRPITQSIQIEVLAPATVTEIASTSSTTSSTSTTSTTSTTGSSTQPTTTSKTSASKSNQTKNLNRLPKFTEGNGIYDYYYDYSHFDYVNEKMNESFIQTVIEVGEDYYADDDGFTESEYVTDGYDDDRIDVETEFDGLPTEADREPSKSADNELGILKLANPEENTIQDTEDEIIENMKDVDLLDFPAKDKHPKLTYSKEEETSEKDLKNDIFVISGNYPGKNSDKKTRKKKLKENTVENETFAKELPLTMNSGSFVGGHFAPIILMLTGVLVG